MSSVPCQSLQHMMRVSILWFVGSLSACGAFAIAEDLPATKDLAVFNDDQIGPTLAHGPWPPVWQRDSSNRVSGQTSAIDLGRQLFFDARLSPSGRISCSSCHRPERSWSDGRPRGVGLRTSRRNTPSLYDVRLNRWFGWGGGGDSLWGQTLRPLLDADEMGSNAGHVKRYFASNAELASAYRAAFGREASSVGDDDALVDAAKALAAYQETIVSGRTAFDAFRDALQTGDRAAAQRYPVAAQRGLAVFIGSGGCSTCHAGPTFTDGSFREIAGTCADKASKTAGEDGDVGRPADAARLLASPYNLAGPFNDDPKRTVPWQAKDLAGASTSPASFRVPSLRNVARTGPYLHDGSCTSLIDAVRSHTSGAGALADQDVNDLASFLETLAEVRPLAVR
jgi:cytochrome c peroxidase